MNNSKVKKWFFAKKAILFSLVFFIFSCNSNVIPTELDLDINRFMGLWYEISSLPTTFNKNCTCSKIELELEQNREYVRMINSCMKKEKQGAVLAKAFFDNETDPSRWKMQLFWPFKTDFYILKVADDYTYAMVGNPDFSQFQILSRTPVMDVDIYNKLIETANELGYDTSMITLTEQNCN